MPDNVAQILGEELTAHADRYAREVQARIRIELPELLRDRELVDLAAVASRSLFHEFGLALQLSADDAHAHAPTAAIVYVRRLARDGVALAAVLRSYRLGQEVAFERMVQLAGELEDPDERMQALARVGALSFQFIDSVMTESSDAYQTEREIFIRGAYARRHTLVRDMLAGLPVDQGEAERTLGHRLDGGHQAVVAWTADGAPASEQSLAAGAGPLAEALGTGRPLMLAGDESSLTIWVTPGPVDPPALGSALDALGGAGMRAAAGDLASGMDGFAATKRQADLARDVARVSRPRPITWYRDVSLAAVLLRDPDAATRFAREELGALGEDTLAARELRTTLAGYFAAGFEQSRAARELNLHRNTLAKRLRRAEILRGASLEVRSLELQTALLVAETLDDA
jgi:DNA-binding PucR family transcriptional regulator